MGRLEQPIPALLVVAPHEDVAPNLEVQQAPEAVRGVIAAGWMALDQRHNLLAIEVFRQKSVRSRESPEQPVGSWIHEPFPHWGGKAHLLAIDDFVRKQVFD